MADETTSAAGINERPERPAQPKTSRIWIDVGGRTSHLEHVDQETAERVIAALQPRQQTGVGPSGAVVTMLLPPPATVEIESDGRFVVATARIVAVWIPPDEAEDTSAT